MEATAIIVFREFLEIALVLTVILAATHGLSGRGVLVATGLILGIAGSVVIAYFTDSISNALDGVGQEVFNAGIMFVAVGFLSWTVVWMRRHGRHLAQQLAQMGQDVLHGHKSLFVIVGAIALATFREGAEIVMFTYGMIASGSVTPLEVATGGMAGAIGGTVVGFMLYFGLLKAARKHLLTVTSWMLIFLSAGMAAQGASFLVAADILPALQQQMWDTSEFIAANSIIGETLGVLVGYTPRPTGIELAFYMGIVVIVGGLYHMAGQRPTPAQPVTA